MMAIGWSRWGVVALLLGGMPLPAEARDLTVGVEAIDYTPVYFSRNGEFGGAAREILDSFAAAQGHRLTYRPLPVKRLLAELLRHDIDLKFPDSPDWQPTMRRGQTLYYSKPVIAYIDGTVVRREASGIEESEIHSIGTVAGFTAFAWGRQIRSGAVTLHENPGFEPLLRQVQAGRIDGAYVNVAVALTAAQGLFGLDGTLVYAPQLPHIADTYRLSSASAPEIIAEFDRWLIDNAALVSAIIARTGAEKGVR
jgi:ABC-type amino acid transport substrate-binding protein